MKLIDGNIRLSPSDLSNFLGCAHLVNLELEVAEGKRKSAYRPDPLLELMRQRGQEFEASYLAHLQQTRSSVRDLRQQPFEATVDAMKRGIDVISQATLTDGNWKGVADFLIKKAGISTLGNYYYEVYDTKLSQHTRNSAVLQLCYYTMVVEKVQGPVAEYMYIVKPGLDFQPEVFRYDDFKSYFQQSRRSLEQAVLNPQPSYPVPVAHCSICNYWMECKAVRRKDDHLSLVAGIRSAQVESLQEQAITTVVAFADEHLKLRRPDRGNLEALERKQEQARVQIKGRETGKNEIKILPYPPIVIDNDEAERHGFNLLPLPNNGDIYFDFEGDAFFPDGGIEYLFGYIAKENNQWIYHKHWVTSREEEKKAFQDFVTFFMQRLKTHRDACIYHYGHKEPSSFKRLMRVHGCCEDEVNALLRGRRFVDLHQVIKRSLLASVENYSLKDMEAFAGYKRQMNLEEAGKARRTFELALNAGNLEELDENLRIDIEKYNEDDCRATLALHQWLEAIREKEEQANQPLIRLAINDGEQGEDALEMEGRAKELFDKLTNTLPADRSLWNDEHKARWLAANMIHYFKRERESAYWEYLITKNKDEEELLDDRKALTGLQLINTTPGANSRSGPKETYTFPPQEASFSDKDELADHHSGQHIGKVIQFDNSNGRIEIQRRKDSADQKISSVLIKPQSFGLTNELWSTLAELAETGWTREFKYPAIIDLLEKRSPRLTIPVSGPLYPIKSSLTESASYLAAALDNSVLALQGPPGTGKTHTGAEMIIALAQQGKKIGVTAISHSAYQNLLLKVHELATSKDLDLKLACKSEHEDLEVIETFQRAQQLAEFLDEEYIVGGTAWLWGSANAVDRLDYLFIDEAGQMSLAYVLAMGRCAKNIVLLGDPNQLDQPQKATHPEGSDVAALTHLLDHHKTMPDDKGLFMRVTRRLHPHICNFTSRLFYEGKLKSADGLERQMITGNTKFSGSGLIYVPAKHRLNQTQSPEEVRLIQFIVNDLLSHGLFEGKKLTSDDILIVAPYNAQVNSLREAITGVNIGTVDRFQGKQAPVVIYSMTASSAEDAPRGMSFLYDPNRFNVATSRAKSICILVASPELFNPDCKTIDQMRWANVLCMYREMAREVQVNGV